MSQLAEKFTSLGFRYPEGLVYAFIGGSTQHGATSDAGTSDTDYYGCFIPPAHLTLGIDSADTYSFPQNTEARSRGLRQPGELDVCLHPLRKFASLAAKGNPTIMGFLFAKPEYVHPVWDHYITKNREKFLAKSHLGAFLGYANDQLERLLGNRGQKDCNRPELESKYGYDTKYAMHIIRLLVEADELMLDGKISYPNLEVGLLKDIRAGKYTLGEIKQMALDNIATCKDAREHSDLPEHVNREEIGKIIADAHLNYWANRIGF